MPVYFSKFAQDLFPSLFQVFIKMFAVLWSDNTVIHSCAMRAQVAKNRHLPFLWICLILFSNTLFEDGTLRWYFLCMEFVCISFNWNYSFSNFILRLWYQWTNQLNHFVCSGICRIPTQLLQHNFKICQPLTKKKCKSLLNTISKAILKHYH